MISRRDSLAVETFGVMRCAPYEIPNCEPHIDARMSGDARTNAAGNLPPCLNCTLFFEARCDRGERRCHSHRRREQRRGALCFDSEVTLGLVLAATSRTLKEVAMSILDNRVATPRYCERLMEYSNGSEIRKAFAPVC